MKSQLHASVERGEKVKERTRIYNGPVCMLNYGRSALMIIARLDRALTYKFITRLAQFDVIPPRVVPRTTPCGRAFPAAHTRSWDLDFIYATTLACRLIGRLGGALLGDRDRVVKRHGSPGSPVMSSSHVTLVVDGGGDRENSRGIERSLFTGEARRRKITSLIRMKERFDERIRRFDSEL